jgi:DNA-binding XRE family transcriptional regulator
MIDVTRNTVVNWEAGKYRPDPDLFPVLCDIFGVTLNDLFGIHPEERVTAHEKMLIKQYRKISPVNRKILERLIRDMVDEEMREKDRLLDENTILLARISTKAAAGNGFSFSDVPIEDYCFVFRDDRNEKADGIILVKGNSMEPVYHDGDQVYIHYTESVMAGEDIICSSPAGIHIKRMGDHGPYSLNKNCPFMPDGEVKIIGRVLGTVSSKDRPDKEEISILEEICHDKIMEFKETHRML